jgi:sugar fermentation stimulation protein A
MFWPSPVKKAKFLKRYKRFFADIELDGQVVVAHVANTGSLKSANTPGQPCLISPASNPERKLKFTLEAIQAPSNAWVGVNTSWPNKLIQEAFDKKLLKHWMEFDEFKAEVKISDETRLDACLKNSKTKKLHYIEVKNVTLAEGDTAYFPDAVTERGQKHLKELMKLKAQGHSVEIIFTIQRSDVKKFAPADTIDPEYGKLLREANIKGVLITPLIVDLNEKSIQLTDQKLPLVVL